MKLAVVAGVLLIGVTAAAAAQSAPGVLPGTVSSPVSTPVTTLPPAAPTNSTINASPASASGYKIISPLVEPTLTPGVILLMELEGRFAQATAEGGGKAFATWFAEDAVTLSNGQPATLGRGAITDSAKWNPKDYQLTWVPQGAQMGPSNDMGFTWGHYEGRAKDKNGQPIITSGRYITVWKKQPNGEWKVAMDASANEPPNAGDCCALPKP